MGGGGDYSSFPCAALASLTCKCSPPPQASSIIETALSTTVVGFWVDTLLRGKLTFLGGAKQFSRKNVIHDLQ